MCEFHDQPIIFNKEPSNLTFYVLIFSRINFHFIDKVEVIKAVDLFLLINFYYLATSKAVKCKM